MSERLCVVMPVYNEQDAIGQVLEKWVKALDALGIDYVIRPYNDGSKDASLSVMHRVASELNHVDVRDKPNGGHGHTILTGYREAVADGFDWVFQIDSDDEMGPEKFQELWARRAENDFLVGYRDGRRQALPRKIISFVSRCVVRLFFGKTIWDVNTPYRLMRASFFKSYYQTIPDRTFAPNVILSGIAARRECRRLEMPVPQHDRTTGEVSIKKWKLLKAAIRSMLQTVGYALLHERRSEKLVLSFTFAAWAAAVSPFLGAPHHIDHWVYLLAAKMQSMGVTLYSGYFDHKGPIHHWLYQCGYFLTHNLWGVWAVECLVFFVALALLYYGARRFAGRHLAVPGCLVAMFINRYPFYPESFSFEFSLAALGVLLLWHDRIVAWFVVGALASACLFLKQTCIGFFCGVGMLCCLHAGLSVWRKRILVVVIAALAVISCVMLILFLQGNIRDYVDCCWTFNVKYSTYVTGGFLGRLMSVVQDQFLMIGLSLVSLMLMLRSPGSGKTVLAMLAVLGFEVVMLAKAGRFHWYQYIGFYFASCMPIVYVVAQCLVQRIPGFVKCMCLASALFVCGGATFLPGLCVSIVDAVWVASSGAQNNSAKDVVALLKKMPPSKLVVWGSACDLYLGTNRESPLSPHYYFNPIIVTERLQNVRLENGDDDQLIIVDVVSTELERIEAARPTKTCTLLNSLRDYVTAHCKRVPFPDDNYRIYVPRRWEW